MAKRLIPRTVRQNNRLFALLSELQLVHMRGELALSFSDGRTSSTAKLTRSECQELIQHLEGQVEGESNGKLEAMCKKFFHYCYELSWTVKETGKLDYPRIRNWLLKYGYLKKPLDSYKQKELYKLLQQVEELLESQNKRESNGD